jgi:hypothetical protein
MTSAIVYNSIDDAFPVAGVDNDSQGFRDNFNVIKNGLATASSEITDLQDNAARTDGNNDFDGNLISNAVLNRVYGSAYQLTVTANANIDLRDGEYQSATIGGNSILTFTNFPETDQYGKVRLELKSNGTQRTITFAAQSPNVIKQEIGVDLTVATGATRNAQLGTVTNTKFSFPTANITTGAFVSGSKLYGSGLIGDVLITAVDSITTTATATSPPLTISYSDITVGTDTILVMGGSISSIVDGNPLTLSDVTGVPELSTTVTYFAKVDGANIKLSSTSTTYAPIVSTRPSPGTTAGTATFPKSGSSANRVTVGNTGNMYVNMPIRFTGTGFGNVSQNTDYFVQQVIDGTGIRITNALGGEPLTLTTASGTLTMVPRTVLTTSFTTQSVSAQDSLTLTLNSQNQSNPMVLSADSSRVKIVEAWKQPYSDIVYLKYIGEFA